jgi:hypothetical protein
METHELALLKVLLGVGEQPRGPLGGGGFEPKGDLLGAFRGGP